MVASKNVASPAAATAAVLVLLPLVMLMRPPTALAARHLPVTTSHGSLISLIPPSTHFPPEISHPPPPPPPHSATDDEEFSVLRKVPRGPGHSPNDPSPPPPPRSATTTAKLSLLPEPDTEQAARNLPLTTSHLSVGPLRLPPPPPATSAADGAEFSVLRKVPRGPGHSPNDPSPPPPLLLVRKQEAAASSSEHPASWCYPPILRDTTDASEPTAAADDNEFSVLRKVPRGPGHSPNDPSPPPPLLPVTKQEAAGSSEHPASWCWIPPSPIDASEPAVAGKQQ